MRKGKSRRKFTSKLLIYNLILFLLVMLAVISVFYFRVWRDTDKRARDDFKALTEKTTSQFGQLLYNMDKTALQIAANPNIVTRFSRIPKTSDGRYFVDNPQIAGEVVKLLNSYNFKRDGNSRICLYNDRGDFVYSAMTMTTVDGVEHFFETEDFRNVKEAFSKENVFSSLRPPGEDILNTSALPSPEYFAVVRQIKDYYTGSQKNGYVEVQQSVEALDEIFRDLGEGCYAAIYMPERSETGFGDEASGQEGKPRLIYRSPALRKPDHEAIEAWFRDFDPEKIPEGTSKTEKGFAARYRTEDLGLFVLFEKQNAGLTAPLYDFLLLLLLMFAVLTLLVFISEKKLIEHLTRPLLDLQHSVRKVGIDNLKLEPNQDEDSDELRELNTVFNAVLARLDSEIEEKILARTNELKAHLFALQSQMNPHFIYNTLAIVSMEAELAGNEKTVQICKALAEMMKYTSSMDDGTATLRDELKHAENYLSLMKQRYEDEFEYQIESDPEVLKQSVSKLLIQPICENSFKHGFADKEGVKRIWVRARAADGAWEVSVEDNGSGFSPEVIENFERFKSNLSLDTLRHALETSELGGLTLENTCLRLFLTYGERFVFRIENTGEGTRVILGGEMR